jgi:hypothetical protein
MAWQFRRQPKTGREHKDEKPCDAPSKTVTPIAQTTCKFGRNQHDQRKADRPNKACKHGENLSLKTIRGGPSWPMMVTVIMGRRGRRRGRQPAFNLFCLNH